MARCPNCSVTVAFHDAPSVKCHGCGKKLYPIVGQDAAGFRLTTVSLKPPVNKPPSKKQDEARSRNWYIRKLRAYFHLCPIREGDRGKQIQSLIDQELISIGAESEIVRTKKRIEEWEEQMKERSEHATKDLNFPEFK